MSGNVKIDELIRSKRRTISLEIDSSARLIVRAPFRSSLSSINSLVREKEDWILIKQHQIEEKIKKYQKKRFIEGDTFMYLGQQYMLILTKDTGFIFSFDKYNFILHENYLHIARNLITIWYKKVAAKKILERTLVYSQKMNINFNKFSISNATKRWGSCGTNGSINFSWRLIMAPVDVIDYVIVHELAHIIELNHSKRFWAVVKKVIPDYAERRKWLKDNDYLLEF